RRAGRLWGADGGRGKAATQGNPQIRVPPRRGATSAGRRITKVRGRVMIDFAALPPEINSARMYSGPGSASMLAAASAWNAMAAEMRSAAASYGSVVSGLTSEGWFGPSSLSMAAAAAPYLEWLSATAAQAEQA